jgi:hypothetical protein
MKIPPLVIVVILLASLNAAEPRPMLSTKDWTKALSIVSGLGRYTGESIPGVDCSTLENKVVVGYQGWQDVERRSDKGNSGLAFTHYGLGKTFEPGHVCIDYWPDVSELGEDEKYETPFKKPDGSPAFVYSPMNRKTVLRHCEWMRDYGIDAAFLQRFAGGACSSADTFVHDCTVLSNLREAANQTGRGYVVMYDLSGLPSDGLEPLKEDWKRLVDLMGITKDPHDKAYLHNKGKPLVAVWGVGFEPGRNESPDKRAFSLANQAKFIDFLQHDTKYGGCSVMVGVPQEWRLGRNGKGMSPDLETLIKSIEVISPWSVGRIKKPEDVGKYAEEYWRPDLEWCKQNGIDYLPVVCPGFSWVNKTPGSKLNEIPRLGGKFLWAQYAALQQLGIKMVYESMFDEMDEGTQIFKVDSTPPVGESKFLWYGYDEGKPLPIDHYLWLVGEAARMIRGQIPFSEEMPQRVPGSSASRTPSPTPATATSTPSSSSPTPVPTAKESPAETPSLPVVDAGTLMSLVKAVQKEITSGTTVIGSVTIPVGTKVKIISVLDDGFMIKRDQSDDTPFKIPKDAVGGH